MSLALCLRSETRDLHEWIERRLDLGVAVTMPRYRRLLEQWFGFCEPFERRAAAVVRTRCWVDPPWRTTWLRHDLKALGASDESLNALRRCPLEELADDPAGSFGSLYVLGGSALGGRVIAGRARAALGVGLDAFRFFDGHGDASAERWKRFRGQLDASIDVDSCRRVVDAARRTFTLLGSWLCDDEANPRMALPASGETRTLIHP